MSENIEQIGGSLDHLNEAGLRSLVRDLQSRIRAHESQLAEAMKEVEEHKRNHAYGQDHLKRVERDLIEKERDALKAELGHAMNGLQTANANIAELEAELAEARREAERYKCWFEKSDSQGMEWQADIVKWQTIAEKAREEGLKEGLACPGREIEEAYEKGFLDCRTAASNLSRIHECSLARGQERCDCDLEISEKINSLHPETKEHPKGGA